MLAQLGVFGLGSAFPAESTPYGQSYGQPYASPPGQQN